MGIRIKLLFFTLIFSSLSNNGGAQQLNVPLGRFYLLETEKHLANIPRNVHTGVKPYIESFIDYYHLYELDYGVMHDPFVYPPYPKFGPLHLGTSGSGFLKVLRYGSLASIDTTDFNLQIDPLFDFAFTRDLYDQSQRADTTNFYTNTRGIRARGSITEKFSFETSFLENQAFFVNYLDSFVRQWQVVPGQGRVKEFKRTGFDYAMASGYVSYSPIKKINLQFGHGKHFIGDGYRSLLLSDNAFNYPYLRVTTNFLDNKFQYTNIFSSLQTLRRSQTGAPREELFVRKAGTFHYLSFSPHRRVQLGFYEGIIWKNSDGNYPQPVNPMFYNPIMGVNTALFAGDSTNHVLNGINIKIKVFNSVFAYGQLAAARLKLSDFAYQAGFRWFEIFGLQNLNLQLEYNRVAPFVYAFPNEIQNYAHYNQPLAHPLMANFDEAIGFLNYKWRSFFIEFKGSLATVQRDLGPESSGNNIFLPVTAQPASGAVAAETAINWREANIGYLINRNANMMIKFGLSERSMVFQGGIQQNRLLTFALSTNLYNRYYDF